MENNTFLPLASHSIFHIPGFMLFITISPYLQYGLHVQGLREKERKEILYLLHVKKIFRKHHLRFSFDFLPGEYHAAEFNLVCLQMILSEPVADSDQYLTVKWEFNLVLLADDPRWTSCRSWNMDFKNKRKKNYEIYYSSCK